MDMSLMMYIECFIVYELYWVVFDMISGIWYMVEWSLITRTEMKQKARNEGGKVTKKTTVGSDL